MVSSGECRCEEGQIDDNDETMDEDDEKDDAAERRGEGSRLLSYCETRAPVPAPTASPPL